MLACHRFKFIPAKSLDVVAPDAIAKIGVAALGAAWTSLLLRLLLMVTVAWSEFIKRRGLCFVHQGAS